MGVNILMNSLVADFFPIKCRMFKLLPIRTPLLMVLCIAQSLLAVSVAKVRHNAIAIRQDKNNPFRAHDPVCVVRGDTKIACGRVVKVTDKEAIVKLSVIKGTVEVGDEAIRLGGRKTAGAGESSMTMARKPTLAKNALGVGFLGGNIYQYTILVYERALSNRWSLRVEPNYFVASAADNSYTISAIGAKIGFSFDSMEAFKGFWINVSGGYYNFTYTPTTGASSIFATVVASGVLGYRFKLGALFSLGFGVGGQYMPFPTIQNIDPIPKSNIIGIGSITYLF